MVSNDTFVSGSAVGTFALLFSMNASDIAQILAQPITSCFGKPSNKRWEILEEAGSETPLGPVLSHKDVLASKDLS
jgi:hypothetical protein